MSEGYCQAHGLFKPHSCPSCFYEMQVKISDQQQTIDSLRKENEMMREALAQSLERQADPSSNPFYLLIKSMEKDDGCICGCDSAWHGSYGHASYCREWKELKKSLGKLGGK